MLRFFCWFEQAEFCQNASRLRWFYDVSPEGFFDTADVQEFSAIPLWTRQLMDADSATVLFVSRAIYCFHVKKMAGHKSHLKHSKGRWVVARSSLIWSSSPKIGLMCISDTFNTIVYNCIHGQMWMARSSILLSLKLFMPAWINL